MGRGLLLALRLVRRAAPLAALATLVLGAFSGAASAPAAWLTKRLVDDLTRPPVDRLQIAAIAAGAMLLVGVGYAAAKLAVIPSTMLEARVQVEAERGLVEACARRVGTRFLDDPVQQDRLRLAEESAHETPVLLMSSATELFSSTAGLMAYVVVLYSSWPAMLLAVFVTAVPIAVIQRRISRRSLAAYETAAAAYRWRDYYSGLFTHPVSARDMRLHGAQQLFVTRLVGYLSTALDSQARMQRRNAWGQLAFTLLNAGVAAAGTVFVALAVADGTITVGDLVLFTAAVTAVQGQLMSLIRLAGQFTVSFGAFAHYRAFVEAEDDAPKATAPVPPLRDAIELRDVWFRYRPDAPWVLRGVNLRLAAGRSHGLVGVNGAGKSTLVNLLLRYYEPERGQILWDGTDIATMPADALRSRLAAVLQDFVPYELTAVENITLGDLDHFGDADAAREAARRARITATIEALPGGYDTMLSTRRADSEGGGGVTLSGGQWQRVALARAMMRTSADLLILDEPNAGLDPQAEHELHTDVMSMGAGRTRLLISHRLGALRAADHIVVLSAGVVAESGTHDQLMAASGLYRELFSLQATPYREQAPIA